MSAAASGSNAIGSNAVGSNGLIGGKLSREERRRLKDLEEARKNGTVAPEMDEDGNAINPHIPEFMAKAPWYMDTGKVGLKHQKSRRPEYNASPSKLNEQIQRGVKIQGSTRYRKGACTNCGAITHTAPNCLERPRKKGAKWTNTNIAPDEFLIGTKGEDWDSKRDQWDGYDPAMHKRVVDEHQALEDARRKMREEQLDKGTAEDMQAVKKVAKKKKSKKNKKAEDNDDFGSSDSDEKDSGEEGDEDKYADAADQAGQKMDAKTRMTVRNLRIREDTAKYLMNLDVESAHYDPKTRSMREAPNTEVAPEDAVFAGDNFSRGSGGATQVQNLQLFAWHSSQRGHDVHINSNPTQGELLHKEFLKKKDQLKETSKVGILEKYGGEEHLERVPRELLGGQTEDYVEYSRTGQIVKGQERAKAKSKYNEDIYPGNHKSVFGSHYSLTTHEWGFACCHSTIKQSYCTGVAGIEAFSADPTTGNMATLGEASTSNPQLTLVEQMAESIRKKAAEAALEQKGAKKPRKRSVSQSDSEAEEDDLEKGREAREKERESRKRLGGREAVGELDGKKLDRAVREEKKRKIEGGERDTKDEYEVSEEQLEAYRMHRDMGHEDPMHNLGADELLPL